MHMSECVLLYTWRFFHHFKVFNFIYIPAASPFGKSKLPWSWRVLKSTGKDAAIKYASKYTAYMSLTGVFAPDCTMEFSFFVQGAEIFLTF